MYESVGNVHQVIDAACVRFASAENIEELAKSCDMRGGMLRNKLNPNQAHQLTLSELIKITKATNNNDIINSAILEVGLVAVRLPTQGDAKPTAISAMSVAGKAGEICNHVIEAESDKRLTLYKKDAIVTKPHSTIRELVFLISDVENRCGGAGPFVSMFTEAVLNGMPIPGM